MFSVTTFLFLLYVAIIQAGCVLEQNCTITPDDPEIEFLSCKGFRSEECQCQQERNVNFVLNCYCCRNQTRQRRDVPLEAMFGLKTYTVPNDTDTKTVQKSLIKFQKNRQANDSCGSLRNANPNKLTSSTTASISDLQNVTIRSTHASTSKNCWNICRYNILSSNQSCTAIGFIEGNSQKPIDDCYILSESPANSTGNDNSNVQIFEICV